MAFASGKELFLKEKLNPADTTLLGDSDVGITEGRIYGINDRQEEWLEFTSVTPSGSSFIYGGLTRGLSQTADPATAGTGQTWLAGTKMVVVAMHDQLLDKSLDNTIGGTQTFNNLIANGDVVFNGSFNVPVYADPTARDAGIPAPANGMEIYLDSIGLFQDYTAGSWVNRAGAANDKLVAVSGDDTTPGTLEQKITAGSGIKLNTNNPGANEDLEFSVDPDVLKQESLLKSFTYGETLAAGNAVYQDTSTGKLMFADPTDSAKIKVIGSIITAGVLDDVNDIYYNGKADGFTGLTIGDDVYLAQNIINGTNLIQSVGTQTGTVNAGVGQIGGNIEKQGQDVETFLEGILRTITVDLATVGTPTGSIGCRVYQSNKTTLLGTSTNSFADGDLTGSYTSQVFNFDDIIIPTSSTIFLEFYKIGSLANSNYYRVAYQNSDVTPGYDHYYYNGSSWQTSSGNDTKYDIQLGTSDGTNYSDTPNSENKVRLGIATSATEIKMVDNEDPASVPDSITATRSNTSASGTVQYNHNLGKIPSMIDVTAIHGGQSSNSPYSRGTWKNDGNDTNKCMFVQFGGTTGSVDTNAIRINETDSDGQVGFIQNVTATTFDVVWTYTATPTARTFSMIFILTP